MYRGVEQSWFYIFVNSYPILSIFLFLLPFFAIFCIGPGIAPSPLYQRQLGAQDMLVADHTTFAGQNSTPKIAKPFTQHTGTFRKSGLTDITMSGGATESTEVAPLVAGHIDAHLLAEQVEDQGTYREEEIDEAESDAKSSDLSELESEEEEEQWEGKDKGRPNYKCTVVGAGC